MYNNFIAEGDKLVIELLTTSRYEIESIFYTQSIGPNLMALISQHADITHVITDKDMAQISQLNTPTSSLALLKLPIQNVKSSLKGMGWGIFLDSVQDPGNVGTIIRTADWFGFDYILANQGTADFYNGKVVQATMGSFCHIDLWRSDDEQIADVIGGVPTFGMYLEGADLAKLPIGEEGLVVLGSEGQGIHPKWQRLIRHKVHLEGAINRGAESLNVGIAAGIVAHHIFNRIKTK